MLLIHGPCSGSVLSSSCCFNCSSSFSRTTIHTQKFEYCFSKISLDPFRYSSKPSESLKLTPFCSQITVPFLFPRLKFPYSQLSQITTTEPKSSLNKLQLILLLVCGSCTAIGSGRKEEKMVPMCNDPNFSCF